MENNNKKEMTIDDLALMVAKGFNEMGEKMDKRFDEVNERIDKIDIELKEVKDDTGNIKADLNKKVDIFTHRSLEHRVEKLEEKFA